MRRPRRLLLVALAAASIGGCQDDDASLATISVREFVRALERGDGRSACDRLAEAGVSELLLAAVRARVEPAGLDAAGAERCAIVATRLAAGAETRLAELRQSVVTGVLLDGERATVRTAAGTYEAAEVEGRWRVTRLEPVVAAIITGLPTRPPVHLTVVRPKLEQPALGASLAGRTDDSAVEISGSLEPADANVQVIRSTKARVRSVESRDGRFSIRVSTRRGRNRLLLRAGAPNRDSIEVSVELTR